MPKSRIQPEWFLTESGEWSDDIDDLPIKVCDAPGCSVEIADDAEYCDVCQAINDQGDALYTIDVSERGPLYALSHFLDRCMP